MTAAKQQEGGIAAGLALWTATPDSLARLGFGVPATVCASDSVAAEGWSADEAAIEAGAPDGLAPAVPGVAVQVQTPGDLLLVLIPEVAYEGAAKLRRILALLAEKNFLRSAVWVEPGCLLGAMRQATEGTGLACRFVDEAVLEHIGSAARQTPAALVSCASIAHLALVNFAERRTGFRVEAIGRVRVEPGDVGKFAMRYGTPASGDAAHPNGQ